MVQSTVYDRRKTRKQLNTTMRATEFIRELLDLIDNVENTYNNTSSNDYEKENVANHCDTETMFSNSPDEMYADEKVIFTIGNDLNKPKNPSDLRTDSFSMYPNMQYNPRK